MKRLIVYGCSQTVALESNDYTLIPDKEHVKKQHGAFAFFDEVKKVIPDFDVDGYLETQKRNSYANLLAEHLGLVCVNRACPGDSNSTMLWRLDQDLTSGFVTEGDTVLVGITSRDRALHFGQKNVKSIMIGYPNTWPESFHKSFLDFYNAEMLAFDLARNLRTMLYLGITKLNNRLFFAETHPYFLNTELSDWERSNGFTDLKPYAKQVLGPVYEEFKTSGNLINDPGITLISGLDQKPQDQLPGGHAPKQWHVDYAKHLAQKMKEKFSG